MTPMNREKSASLERFLRPFHSLLVIIWSVAPLREHELRRFLKWAMKWELLTSGVFWCKTV
jgi:hypothetical protein